jgi:hypothetical protein
MRGQERREKVSPGVQESVTAGREISDKIVNERDDEMETIRLIG